MRHTDTPPTDRYAFLAALAQSELLTTQQFAKADRAVPESVASASEAAKLLVASKLLTQFQSERLLAGRTDGFVLGQYIIQEQVGKGSVGRVYRALHRTMNRVVAIKVLIAEATRTGPSRQTFQREMKAAAHLNHPNIVTTFDANEIGDRSYLVMEFVDGPTLEVLVRQRGPLPWPEACELIRQAALGLQHAHEQGIVHRDIKPANLLVMRPSRVLPGCVVKIADFGIARLSSSARTATGLIGTPDYVSPEQAYNPQGADYRADLYSLGCVFYFLLTGRPPFPGGSAEEKIRRHQFEWPAPIESLRRDVPPAVIQLAMQLMAKDPLLRPASAGDVATQLGALSAIAPPCDGDMVNFDLPPVQPGPYSFASGYLTGARPRATVAGFPPPDGVDTSPWTQLTDEILDAGATAEASLEQTPFTPRVSSPHSKRPPRGASSIVVLCLCGIVVITCLLGLSFLLKLCGK